MSAVTVKFPGMRPAILARADELGITEEAAWAEREQEAEDNLADAAVLLEAVRPAGVCEAWIPAFAKKCGQVWPDDPARRVRRACVHEHVRDGWVCDIHLEAVANGCCLQCFETDGHECPITIVPIAEVAP